MNWMGKTKKREFVEKEMERGLGKGEIGEERGGKRFEGKVSGEILKGGRIGD